MKRVWCVAYDSDVPTMSGEVQVVRQGEWDREEFAKEAIKIVGHRSLRAPKKNLRLQSRMVTEWEDE